jgi:hypothetical protein
MPISERLDVSSKEAGFKSVWIKVRSEMQHLEQGIVEVAWFAPGFPKRFTPGNLLGVPELALMDESYVARLTCLSLLHDQIP